MASVPQLTCQQTHTQAAWLWAPQAFHLGGEGLG